MRRGETGNLAKKKKRRSVKKGNVISVGKRRTFKNGQKEKTREVIHSTCDKTKPKRGWCAGRGACQTSKKCWVRGGRVGNEWGKPETYSTKEKESRF